MVGLPIAERDLRVGARSPATYNFRRNAAAVALIIFFALFWSVGFSGGWMAAKIFRLLSLLTYVYALLAGVILAADSVSAEKRDGTLGLLFLTALKPYDLVVGSISANSLKAFYGLLAIFPVLGISFLLGGVEWSEFARVCLALGSALLFSLSWSLLISCLSRKHIVAASCAIAGLVFFALLVPGFCAILRKLSPLHAGGWVVVLNVFSPTTMLDAASPGIAPPWDHFWYSCAAVNSMSIALLFLCGIILPRVWRDHPGQAPIWTRAPSFRRTRISWFALRKRARTRLLEKNPFLWLATRASSESTRFLLFALFLAAAASFLSRLPAVAPAARVPDMGAFLFVWAWVLGALHAAFAFKVAALSTARLSEDRRLGALESLLVTPLGVRQILRGQWHALAAQLTGPALAVLFIHSLILCAFLTLFGLDQNIAGGTSGAFHALLDDVRFGEGRHWPGVCAATIIVASAFVLFLDWIALGWVGMWMAMRTRRATTAVWATLRLVLLPPLPFFALIVGSAAWMRLYQDPFYWAWFCIATGVFLAVTNALTLTACCWWKLARNFRPAASNRFTAPAQPSFARSVRFTVRVCGATAAIALLIGGFYAEEKWRGLRAWRKLQNEYAARGLKLNARFVPPPPEADAENFGAAKIFQPLFDYSFDARGQSIWRKTAARRELLTLTVTAQERSRWRKLTNESQWNWALQRPVDLEGWAAYYRTNAPFSSLCTNDLAAPAVLEALQLFDPELNEIEEASRRPKTRFPIHYAEGFTAMCMHFTVLPNISEILELRAVAKLADGNSAGAREDANLCLRLADAILEGPGVHPFLTRQIILLQAVQVVWEGLARHAWRAEDLAYFQERLRVDLLAEYQNAVRQQISATADFWETFVQADEQYMKRLGPIPANPAIFPLGWKYLNQTRLFQLCDHTLLPFVDPKGHRVFPAKADSLAFAVRTSRVAADPVSRTMVPYQTQMYMDGMIDTAHAQVSLDQAVIACALDRFRQSQGIYPETLQELGEALPHDVITGEPYRYRRPWPGEFVLYSVGWNGKDDSALPGIRTKATCEQELNAGDWVWKYPGSDAVQREAQ